MNKFVEYAEDRYIKPLKQEIEEGDFNKIKNTIHKIKGALGVICAEKAMNTAMELELAAENNDLAVCNIKLVELQQACQEIIRITSIKKG